MEVGLEESLSGQMQYTYFPVRLGDLRSRISFHEVGEDTFQAGKFQVATQYLNHTCPAVGYRLTVGGVSVAYLSDHEPFWPHDSKLGREDLLHHPADRRHIAFAEGVDLLIHDAQYTDEEYPGRRGWDHSTVEYAVDVAAAAGAKRLALFHHDPGRSDDAVDELVSSARRYAEATHANVDIFGASEGKAIEMAEHDAGPTSLRPLVIATPSAPARILLLGNEERRRQLRGALTPDAYRMNEADLTEDGHDWAALDPDLAVIAVATVEDATILLRRLTRSLPDRPLVVVIDEVENQLALRHLGEIASDVIGVPFFAPNLRARVRACLARSPGNGRLELTNARQSLDTLAGVSVVPPDELPAMLQTGAACGFRPGEVLFQQGETGSGVYFIRRGLARVVVVAPDGGEVTVGYAGPGEILGEMSALDGSLRSATVVAIEPVEASYITQEAFREAIGRAPEASLRVLQLLVRRLRALDKRMGESSLSHALPSGGTDKDLDLESKLKQLQSRIDELGLTRENLAWDLPEKGGVRTP
ncbi:MAG: cyclic nucleotide-binding domain-containing protein [Chloroflexi bacterium]|nr:cyclic nucleotide-binding domain-containing protein [Chloroflexota bacterium]